MTIRVLVADDQALVRAGIRMLVETQPDLEVVGEAEDGMAAVSEVIRSRPDVVLMDVRMPRLDGIEAARRIMTLGPEPAKVVMLTTFDLDEYVFDALSAGATGFLLKHARPEELLFGIRAAADGHALIAPALTRRLIERFAGGRPRAAPELGRLTDREREVLTLLVRGLSNAEIASRLFVGESTVKTHVARVFTKLGLRDRAQAVIYGYETGLVTPGGPSSTTELPSRSARRGPEGLGPAAAQRTLHAAEGRAICPPVERNPEVRSLRADREILRGDRKVAAPVRDAVRQVGRCDILASADALEQAIALAGIGMLTVHKQPDSRSRAGSGAHRQRDHGKRAGRRVGKREHGATGIGRQSRSRRHGERLLLAGIPQRRTQVGDRVIPVRHEQRQERDHAQAGQQDQDDRDLAAAASRWPPLAALRSRFERQDIRLPVHALSPATKSRLTAQRPPRAPTSAGETSVRSQ